MIFPSLLLVSLAVAQASDSTPHFEIAPYLGMYFPTKSFAIDSIHKETPFPATGFGLMFGRWLNRKFAVEIDVGFTRNSVQIKTGQNREIARAGNNIFLANSRFIFSPNLPNFMPWRLYSVSGIGFIKKSRYGSSRNGVIGFGARAEAEGLSFRIELNDNINKTGGFLSHDVFILMAASIRL